MKKIPAVFLDRDGVLNKEKGHITSLEQMEIFPYSKECVEVIHKCGYLAIVISNQSAVGRGMLSEEKLCSMNEALKKILQLDAVYYCPHWNEGNQTICSCRKPHIGMIMQAEEDFNIDLEKSYFVGDRDTDIQTGKNGKMKTVLLKSGYPQWMDALCLAPDYIYHDLTEFVDMLKRGMDKENIESGES